MNSPLSASAADSSYPGAPLSDYLETFESRGVVARLSLQAKGSIAGLSVRLRERLRRREGDVRKTAGGQ